MDEYVNIIWYDMSPSDQTKSVVSTIYYRIFLCTDTENLQKTINNDIHDTEKILLVLSGNMDHELILNTVHHEHRIVSIFILTHSFDISCAKYSKICGIFNDYVSLEKEMLKQARILNHQAITFDFAGKLNERSMEELLEKPEVGLFDMHSRFLSGTIIVPELKDKMVNYCRCRYITNATQLKLIDEFEKTYESKDAFRWYSKDCFLFSSLNKCLRKQSGNVYDCDMVYFAVDLSRQIQSEWKKQRENKNDILKPFHLYRGLNLPETEISRIQEYVGKTITAKGFLSTTKSFAVAKMFAANVILDIEIDPKLENIIYADILTYSHIPDEEEVLIDYGTSFRIAAMDLYPEADLWLIELESVNEIEQLVESYIDLKRSQQEDDIMIANGLVFFGYNERACRFLKESINATNNNMDKIDLNCELGEIHAQYGQFQQAADYLREAHRLCTLFYPYSLRLHRVTFWLAMMYACLNEHDEAFNYLTIRLEFPDPKPYSLPCTTSSSWSYLVTNEETLRFDPYRLVYEHLQQCLNQFEQDKDICCKVHLYISLILLKCNREEITLHSLDESLMHLKISGRLRSKQSTGFLVIYYYHMGVVYESKENYSKAKRYYRKIVTLLISTCNSNEKLIIMHVRIASCYAAQKIYALAMKYYMKALEQSLENGDSILISKVQANLAITFIKRKQYNEAVEQLIYVSTISNIITRQFIEEIYLIIAETLLKANDRITAIKYYLTYLDQYEEVEQKVFGCWYDTCKRLVDIYCSENQFDSATIYAKKMLECKIKNWPDDFEEILDAHVLVAVCYQNNNEYLNSIDYYKMAYDTLSKMTNDISTEDYNPLISDEAVSIQSMIANLYQTVDDYEQAIYHATIALETEQKRQSRDKITIVSCYDYIGWCYYKKDEYRKALDSCTKGLHLLYTCALEFDRRCCNIYHSLATIWLKLGDFKQSFAYSMKAVRILGDSPDFEGKKCMLDDFYLLLDRLCKQKDTSLQYELSSNTTDGETMVNCEYHSSNNIQKDCNPPSEDEIRLILASTKFTVIDSLNAGDRLHKIILQEALAPSSPIYPKVIYTYSYKRRPDLTNNETADDNFEEAASDTIEQ